MKTEEKQKAGVNNAQIWLLDNHCGDLVIRGINKDYLYTSDAMSEYASRKQVSREKIIKVLPKLEKGDKIKLYGKETIVKGFDVHWNNDLNPPQYEIILLTTGRGDPFYRSLDKIELTEGEEETHCPNWYSEKEMYDWLIHEHYSKEIATELAEKYAIDLQRAFKKGWDKRGYEQPQAEQDEVLNGIAIFNELKGISKVELVLSDNAFRITTDYMDKKYISYPVKLSRSDVADTLLEFVGVIEREIKKLSSTPSEQKPTDEEIREGAIKYSEKSSTGWSVCIMKEDAFKAGVKFMRDNQIND